MNKTWSQVLWLLLLPAGMGCGLYPEGPKACAQVLVAARPPEGGACMDFPTPCDVPEDYVTCCRVPNGFCTANEECVDDPKDACDPAAGGTDCQGICRPR